MTSHVTAPSRRAKLVEGIQQRFGGERAKSVGWRTASQAAAVLEGSELLLNAGGAGVMLVPKCGVGGPSRAARGRRSSTPCRRSASKASRSTDDGVEREGVTVFGALGVGRLKMKIHKACIARLFERNDLVLDAETIAEVARELHACSELAGHAARHRHRSRHGQHRHVRPGRRPRLSRSIASDRRGARRSRRIVDRSARAAAPLDLVAGPSGYGLPLTRASDLTEAICAWRISPPKGSRVASADFARSCGRSRDRRFPVVLTPGVVHLASVPAHRKVNRVDMGTADKVCAAALAIREQARARSCAVRDGRSSCSSSAARSPRRWPCRRAASWTVSAERPARSGCAAAGALDGEVAFLAGSVPKSLLFDGGAAEGGRHARCPTRSGHDPRHATGRLAWEAYMEGVVKAVATLAVTAPDASEVILSGRIAHADRRAGRAGGTVGAVMRGVLVRTLRGFAAASKQGAQGAALIADGLAGGASAPLVDALGIREARGTVLDHLYRDHAGLSTGTSRHRLTCRPCADRGNRDARGCRRRRRGPASPSQRSMHSAIWISTRRSAALSIRRDFGDPISARAFARAAANSRPMHSSTSRTSRIILPPSIRSPGPQALGKPK